MAEFASNFCIVRSACDDRVRGGYKPRRYAEGSNHRKALYEKLNKVDKICDKSSLS